MKSQGVLLLLVAICAASVASLSNVAAQADTANAAPSPAGLCTIKGYRQLFQTSTPAYLPGETARQSELGASLTFPIPALGYDPATQRFTVSMAPAGDEGDNSEAEAALVELRRKHVVFEGDACPGKTDSGGSIRCFEATTLASRGSNPVYCQKDKPASE